MRTQLTVTDAAGNTSRSMFIQASEDHTVSEVLDALRTEAGLPAADSGSAEDGVAESSTPLGPDALWASAGVVDGSVLRLGPHPALVHPAAAGAGDGTGTVHLRATGGPLAGSVLAVQEGKLTFGSDPACTVLIEEDDMPAVAAVMEVGPAGDVSVARANADVNLSLDEENVLGTMPWMAGGVLRMGRSRFELAPSVQPVADLRASEEAGKLDYNRPPRLLLPRRSTLFKLPPPPGEEQRQSLPVLAALTPLVLAIGTAVLMQRPTYLLMGLLSPLVMIVGHYGRRKTGALAQRDRARKYRAAKESIEADARQALMAFEQERQMMNPDPATAGVIATLPSPRLWERRRTDPDHLSIRLGTCSMPSDVTVEDPEQAEHRQQVVREAHDIPVTVNLPERGVLGVCGDGETVRNLTAWIVGQLAVAQSPQDVRFYLLASKDSSSEWEWVRWLPHSRPDATDGPGVLIGSDQAGISARISELSSLVAERLRMRQSQRQTPFDNPDIVIVLDGARRLRSIPGVAQILSEGPSVGVYAVCLDTEERLLPEECGAVFKPGDAGAWTLAQQRATTVQNVVVDTVPWNWFEWVARSLAPVRDASDDDEAVLPSAARLLEVVDLEPPTAEAITRRWAVSGRSTTAVIGVSLDGPFAVDIVRDGPHGLIAGTTGSGKSELLQTLVASLAAANRPDEMTFVLIDYKGGAAFKDCADLPHTVGMVTDLDSHLVERALESLAAELRRREHILGAAGAKDIEDYLVLADRDPGMGALPRLMIIIDEFASMKAELPDFIDALVSIAQRGRSLGIHLVLATQRPSGSVSADIRANSNLRVALRVTDAGDSQDVLDAPDAARIGKNTPGRGFMRSGAASLLPFQSGRVGGRRPGARSTETAAPQATVVAWDALGEPVRGLQSAAPETTGQETTDLAVLVDVIREAAQGAGIPCQPSPWLPALPENLVLTDLQAVPGTAPVNGGVPAIPFGLEDLPARQDQQAKVIDFESFTHLYICGSARSGRSQTLRTIAGSIAANAKVDDVHLYGLDFGNGALLPVEQLPHCGAVATRTQPERAQRLIDRLTAEMARRQQLLATQGFAGIVEQRTNASTADRLPHLVVLFDQWEGFLTNLGENGASPLAERITTLLREGSQTGIHFIITGDKGLLNTRMSSLVENKLVLRFSDRADYTLAGLQPRKMPEKIPAGRAFIAEYAIETQIALLSPDPSGQAQADALRGLATQAASALAASPALNQPFRLEALPTTISFEDAWITRQAETSPLWAMIGVGGDLITAIGTDLAAGPPSFLIAGPPRSGRSTALETAARSLLHQGAELVLITPRPTPLQALTTLAGVRATLSGAQITGQELDDALAAPGPAVIVIDDAELLTDNAIKDWLRDYLRRCPGTGRGLVAAAHIDEFGNGFSGWQVDVRNNRNGALLAPNSPQQGALIGARLTKASIGQNTVTGRAIVHRGDGAPITVQVPHAR